MRSTPRVLLALLSVTFFFLYNAYAQQQQPQPPNNSPIASFPNQPPPSTGSSSNNSPPTPAPSVMNPVNGTSPPSNQTSPSNQTLPSNQTSPSAPVNSTNSNPLIGLPTSADNISNTVQAAYAHFITPAAPTSSMIPLYPINGNITFVWGYDTNIKVQPVSLTLCAVPTSNTKYTYTITQMPGLQTSVVWDTKPLQTGNAPLMMGKYQIMLFDQRGASAVYSPGWLVPAKSLTIGLYIPESYTPYSNPTTCATCYFENNFPKDTLNALAVTFAVSVLTTAGFLWFAL